MKKLLLALILSLPLPLVVLAQAPAEKSAPAEESHEGSLSAEIFRWANFVVLFGGLGYALRKPLKEFLETRRKEIADGLSRASRAQEEARRRLDEIDARLARLTADMEAFHAEADVEARAEYEKLLTEAKHEVDRIVEQTRQEIDRVARGVERHIKEVIADQVIQRAERTLRSRMTNDDHKRVTVRFIKSL